MTALVRLYTGAEAMDACQGPVIGELEARFRIGLANAVDWMATPGVRCSVCDSTLNGTAGYVMVLMASDPESGFGMSGVICSGCAVLPRQSLETHAQQVAMLLFEETRGNA